MCYLLVDVTANGLSVVDPSLSRYNDSFHHSVRERIDLTPEGLSQTPPPIPATEQDQLQTILRTLRKLPPDEAERLSVDLSDDEVVVGSERAEQLKLAWERRQQELRDAMKSLMKPAEFMGNLTQQLRDKVTHFYHLLASTPSNSEEIRQVTSDMNQLLVDLESLLTDVDNGRDFHTIGAWPDLTSFLSPSLPLSTRSRAAWAIGSAMKNSYDYQLWTLEPVSLTHPPSNTTCLQLLLNMFQQSSLLVTSAKPSDAFYDDVIDFAKRTIYALSSAIRGNIDVQDAIQSHSLDIFYLTLHSFLSTPSIPTSITRKIFSLMSDLLDERQYIRFELSAEMRDQLFPATSSPTTSSQHKEVTGTISLHNTSSSIPALSNDVIHQMSEHFQNLHLLADHLLSHTPSTSHWSVTSVQLLERYIEQLKSYDDIRDKNDWIATHLTIETMLKLFTTYFTQHHQEHHISALPLFQPHHRSEYDVLFSLLEEVTRSPFFTQNTSFEDIVARGQELNDVINQLTSQSEFCSSSDISSV
eukprot:gene3833-4095_t